MSLKTAVGQQEKNSAPIEGIEPKALTLYNIEMGLLELIQVREEILADPDALPSEQAESIAACDQRIAEYLDSELRKVDGVVYTLLEFQRRADVEDDEIARIKARRDRWQAYHDRLEEQVIGAMQLANKTELRGERETLKLRKNPPSVDVRQPELVPIEFCTQTVKIRQALWKAVHDALEKHDAPLAREFARCGIETAKGPEPMKAEIAKVLKSTTPCPNCGGTGEIEDDGIHACEACGGSGKIQGAVAGCQLVQNVRLVIE